MSKEYEITEALKKIPYIRSELLIDWVLHAQSWVNPRDVLKEKAADNLAQTFAGHVLRRNKFVYI